MLAGATPSQVPSTPTKPTASTNKRKPQQQPAFVSPQRRHLKRTRINNSSTSPSKLVVTKELIDLFIELDKLEETFLKKAISIVRQKLEEGEIGTAVEVIDVDAERNFLNENEATNDVNEAVNVAIETGTVSTHHPITTDHQRPSTQPSSHLQNL